MYNQDSNDTTNGKKSITNFKNDAVNGESIVGGGVGSFRMPTPEEEAAGINNSGFDSSKDVTSADDGSVQVIDDGTVKVI